MVRFAARKGHNWMKLPSYTRIRRIRILFQCMEDALKKHGGDPMLEVVIIALWSRIVAEVRRG